MCNPKQISHQVSFVVFAFFLVGIVGWSCQKKSLGNVCLTCTATYSTGALAGSEEACGDAEQRAFKEEYHYVEDAGGTIECRE